MNRSTPTVSQPPHSDAQSSSFVIWLANLRWASFSLLLHVILLVVLGSIVLYPPTEKPEDFVAGDGSLIASTENLPPAPEATMEQPTLSEPTVASPTSAAATMSVLSTTAPNVGFQVNAKTDLSALGTLGKADASAKSAGTGKALAGLGAGAGMGGAMGRGRFFGSRQMNKNGSLAGRFYDLKQTRAKRPSNVSPDEYHKIFRKFVKDDWNPNILNDYFRSPKMLYATQIMIPNMSADEGPKAFELEKEVQPSRWLVHYTARVSPSESGTYRFVGAGDDVMVVRFNGKVVLDRCWSQADEEWHAKKNYNYGWTGIPNGFAQGDAIEVKEGEWYDMEVLIGEQPGGLVFACLLLEKEGEEYPKDPKGNPVLPIFRLADLPMPELQAGQTLPPYMPVGPVWRAQMTAPR